MKTMTQKQAWQTIADAYEKVIAGEAEAGFSASDDHLAVHGLCHATMELRREGRITLRTLASMERKIEGALEDAREFYTGEGAAEYPGWNYLWRYNVEGAEKRAMLATLFAEMSR